jgi:hypothetical protein
MPPEHKAGSKWDPLLMETAKTLGSQATTQAKIAPALGADTIGDTIFLSRLAERELLRMASRVT